MVRHIYDQMIEDLKNANIITATENLNPQSHRLLIANGLLDELVRLTSFLTINTPTKQRLYTIILKVTEHPTCNNPACNKKVPFHLNGRNAGKYATYCSHFCSSQDPCRTERIRTTKQHKYGTPTYNNREIARLTLAKTWDIPTTSLVQLEDATWLEQQHKQKKSIRTISAELGVSPTAVQNRFKQFDISIQRFASSYPEQQLIKFVRSVYDGVIIEHDRTIIHPYELDLYFPDESIAIEFNGTYWHGEKQGKDSKYHINKLKMCEDRGIQLIQIWEYQWDATPNIVQSVIRHKLGKTEKKINARECVIKAIDFNTAESFLKDNHIQGPARSSVNIGMFHENGLVEVMTFGKPRFNTTAEYELIRLASSLNVVVRGGASKLFTYFVEEFKPNSVVSYAARDRSIGSIYEVMGFKLLHACSPGYVYHKHGKIYTRNTFQKHKLDKILESFDPELTEYQNMKNNGYDRLWNCGNLTYLWEQNDSA